MDPSREIHYFPIITAAALCDNYVAGTIIPNASEYNALGLTVDYTQGTSASMELKVETSQDGTTYFQQIMESATSGTTTATVNEYTMTSDGDYAFLITPIRGKMIKVSIKGTTPGDGTATVKGYLSWA